MSNAHRLILGKRRTSSSCRTRAPVDPRGWMRDSARRGCRPVQLMQPLLEAGVPLAIGSGGAKDREPHPQPDARDAAPEQPERSADARAGTARLHGSAYAEFAEKEKGAIGPNMLADLAILSQDILTAPSEALPATRAVVTIVGGRVVHEKQ